jgi:hypothetical protein
LALIHPSSFSKSLKSLKKRKKEKENIGCFGKRGKLNQSQKRKGIIK